MAKNYEYKCVPGSSQLVVKSEKDSGKAVSSYANIINGAATDGWEFYSLESISVAQASGCLQIKKVPPVIFYMLIFRREI